MQNCYSEYDILNTVPSKYGLTSDANEKAFTLLTATDEPELSYELEKYSL